MKKRFKKFDHSKKMDKQIRREYNKIPIKVRVQNAYNALIDCIKNEKN